MAIHLMVLILASICTLLFIIGCLKGRKYVSYTEGLDSGDYPLKGLYVVGFGLNNLAPFRLRGKLAVNLKRNAKILFGDKYFEFYALVAWAQFLSLGLLLLCLVLLVGSLVGGGGAALALIVAVFLVVAVWDMAINKMKSTLTKRSEECLDEFPNMISKLSLLINSGMVLRDAWKQIAESKDGELYTLMCITCEMLDNGESDISALYNFGVLSNTPEIKKFSSAIIQGIEKTSVGLIDFLLGQTSELWARKRQDILRKGEVAAGKLIAPIGIMFVGVIIIILSAAMQNLAF